MGDSDAGAAEPLRTNEHEQSRDCRAAGREVAEAFEDQLMPGE